MIVINFDGIIISISIWEVDLDEVDVESMMCSVVGMEIGWWDRCRIEELEMELFKFKSISQPN